MSRNKREHIDELLQSWPYEPNSLSVRIRPGKDRRDVIQMRLDLGLLQLETTGRPDGWRPGGEETYLDLLQKIATQAGEHFVMNEEQCAEADREFVQYYHRRLCWLALREFTRAMSDAEHTLRLMDLCRKHSPDEEWTASHEQYRPFVLFHRTQAAALSQLEQGNGAEASVQAINEGLDTIRTVFQENEAEDEFESDELVERLVEMRETLRKQFDVGRTLEEQLNDAVAAEKYELAARLRDELANRRHGSGR
jgi:cysteinyl-tRNA synthetase